MIMEFHEEIDQHSNEDSFLEEANVIYSPDMTQEEIDQRVTEFVTRTVLNGKIIVNICWYTPTQYLDAVRELMGGIDIDPATDERAQKIIQAKVYYTQRTNGLDKDWIGRLWLGTPYKWGLIEQFTEKAIDEYEAGNVTEGIILTHTNNTQYEYFQRMLRKASAFCLVKDYIRWIKGHWIEELAMKRMGISWSPEYTKHGNVFVYLGSNPTGFNRIFSKFGVCLCKIKI